MAALADDLLTIRRVSSLTPPTWNETDFYGFHSGWHSMRCWPSEHTQHKWSWLWKQVHPLVQIHGIMGQREFHHLSSFSKMLKFQNISSADIPEWFTPLDWIYAEACHTFDIQESDLTNVSLFKFNDSTKHLLIDITSTPEQYRQNHTPLVWPQNISDLCQGIEICIASWCVWSPLYGMNPFPKIFLVVCTEGKAESKHPTSYDIVGKFLEKWYQRAYDTIRRDQWLTDMGIQSAAELTAANPNLSTWHQQSAIRPPMKLLAHIQQIEAENRRLEQLAYAQQYEQPYQAMAVEYAPTSPQIPYSPTSPQLPYSPTNYNI